MDPLLENAMASIRLGVEDYESKNPERALSAIRNLHAGILLMFKEALRRRSPAGTDGVLVMADVEPAVENGELRYVVRSKNTAAIPQIKERFAALGIEANWNRFGNVKRVRNEIEHHYTTANHERLRGLLADSMVIIREFMRGELREEPTRALGFDAWEAMLNVSEVFEKERSECRVALAKVKWESPTLARAVRDMACQYCGSPLLMPDSQEMPDMQCRKCEEDEHFAEYVERALALHFDREPQDSAWNGEDPPVAPCPECFAKAYILSEERCAACGHHANHECQRCGEPIEPDNLGEPFCGYCTHMLSKDD